jgi:DNA polymerase-4
MGRAIIHLDMDAFFAAVEELRNPELRGRPVVVGGDGNPRHRGVVSTCNYEARKFGIHSAMPLITAFRLCPEAVFLAVDMAFYEKFSHRIMAILREYTPLVEPLGLDEAFLDVSPSSASGTPMMAVEIAQEMKKRIMAETGLSASVGVAPNKLLAKITSGINKPDGLTIVEETEIEEFLEPLPVRTLWGVGPKTDARLAGYGIRTVGELRRRPLPDLQEHFGKAWGQMLYDHSRGIDESPVVTHWEPKSISRDVTFQWDVKKPEIIEATVTELTRDLVGNLTTSGYVTRTLTLKIRYHDFTTFTRSTTATAPLQTESEILPLALALINRFDWTKKVRLVGVRVSNLIKNTEKAQKLKLTAEISEEAEKKGYEK